MGDIRLISVFVVVGGGKKTLNVPQNSLVSYLIKEINSKYLQNAYSDQNLEDIQLVFGGKVLLYTATSRLPDVNIEHASVVMVIMSHQGGMSQAEEIERKQRELVDLPGLITVTTDSNEPDMITFDDSPTNRRAKMPCGHVIGPKSMTAYCRSLLSAGRFIFPCPAVQSSDSRNTEYCNQTWDYFLVRHVACLSAEEQEEFESKIAEIYAQKAIGVQTCPQCYILCSRKNKTNNRVICGYCTKLKRRNYEFCWSCLREWKGAGTTDCGNSPCDGSDGRLLILEKCPTKIIDYCNVECPKYRACPKCGIMIEHKDKCKHICCFFCKHDFCFICLKGKSSSGWECGSYSAQCTVAPRQTSLPEAS